MILLILIHEVAAHYLLLVLLESAFFLEMAEETWRLPTMRGEGLLISKNLPVYFFSTLRYL